MEWERASERDARWTREREGGGMGWDGWVDGWDMPPSKTPCAPYLPYVFVQLLPSTPSAPLNVQRGTYICRLFPYNTASAFPVSPSLLPAYIHSSPPLSVPLTSHPIPSHHHHIAKIPRFHPSVSPSPLPTHPLTPIPTLGHSALPNSALARQAHHYVFGVLAAALRGSTFPVGCSPVGVAVTYIYNTYMRGRAGYGMAYSR